MQKQCQSCTTLFTGKKKSVSGTMTFINETRVPYNMIRLKLGEEGKGGIGKKDIKIIKVVIISRQTIFFPLTFQDFCNVVLLPL